MGAIGNAGGAWTSGTSGSPEIAPKAADLLSDLGEIARKADPSWYASFDTSKGVKSLANSVRSDGRITNHDVRRLVTEAYDYGAMTASEKTVLRSLLSKHSKSFEPSARTALARFLGVSGHSGAAPDSNLLAALRPGPTNPTERQGLASIDAGFDFWGHTESEGATLRAASAVKQAEKIMGTSLTDWSVSDSEKASAAKALHALSPKEFLWALNQLWGEFRADGTSEASMTRSAFLFEPKQRAKTDAKLDQLESYFGSNIKDAKAKEVVLDYLVTMRTGAWNK